MSTIKIRHPRLKNAELSLADGLVSIDADGIIEGDLTEAQRAKAALMGWEVISVEAPKPKPKRRRTTRKKADNNGAEG
jgi:hypothetical protein